MKPWLKWLRYLVIVGNAVFILWITYNGVDEGFAGTPAQIVSYVGLISVLLLDIFLLIGTNKEAV